MWRRADADRFDQLECVRYLASRGVLREIAFGEMFGRRRCMCEIYGWEGEENIFCREPIRVGFLWLTMKGYLIHCHAAYSTRQTGPAQPKECFGLRAK